MSSAVSPLPRLLREHQAEVLKDWTARQAQSLATRRDLISDAELSRDRPIILDCAIPGINEAQCLVAAIPFRSLGFDDIKMLVRDRDRGDGKN